MGRRERRALLLASTATLVCLAAGLLGLGSSLRAEGRSLFAPASAPLVDAGTGLGDLLRGAGEIGQVWQQNRSLQARLDAQTAEIARLRDVESENRDLKSELGLPLYQNALLAPAEVIGRGPGGTLIVNRGDRDGLKTGMPVVKSGSLVGQVSEVSRSSAVVRLLTDPRVEIPASIIQDHLQGLVSPQGGGLDLSLVPKGQPVHQGSQIVSSGVGETFPSGILIGTVASVSSEGNGLFQTIRITPRVSAIGLRRVFILTGHK